MKKMDTIEEIKVDLVESALKPAIGKYRLKEVVYV